METKNKDSKDDASSPPYNLTLMLLMLKRHGVNDSMLCRKYGLNKHSLSKIKRGECLVRNHSDHFEKLQDALESLLDKYEMTMDAGCYQEVKDFVLEVYRMEHGRFKESAIRYVKMLIKRPKTVPEKKEVK